MERHPEKEEGCLIQSSDKSDVQVSGHRFFGQKTQKGKSEFVLLSEIFMPVGLAVYKKFQVCYNLVRGGESRHHLFY